MSISKKLTSRMVLVYEMAKRDVLTKYQGSVFGVLWSLFNPIFMLIVYTFAFGFIFKARWPGIGDDPYSFALALFPALLVFNYFSENVSRAPSLILSNQSYVKKVVFPLEVLPLVVSLSALFHFLLGVLIWCIAYLVLFGKINLGIVALPIIMLPLIFFSLACSWVLSSLGVYLRDIQQIVNVVTGALIFLSPVFYPIESVPESFRPFIRANPLTGDVEMIRNYMLFNRWPSIIDWCQAFLLSCLFAFIGYRWFLLTKKGFADVL